MLGLGYLLGYRNNNVGAFIPNVTFMEIKVMTEQNLECEEVT